MNIKYNIIYEYNKNITKEELEELIIKKLTRIILATENVNDIALNNS